MDEGDWLCLQCGTYYYTGLYRRSNNDPPPGPGITPSRLDKEIGSERLQDGFADPGAASLVTVGTLKRDCAYDQGYTSMAQAPGSGPTVLK